LLILINNFDKIHYNIIIIKIKKENFNILYKLEKITDVLYVKL